MKKGFCIAHAVIAAMFAAMSVSHAAPLSAPGEVSGTVSGSSNDIIPVFLYNNEKNVGYGVFAVNGSFRATNMFPGRYDITVQNWSVPSQHTYEMATMSVEVTSGGQSKVHLSPKLVAPTLNYTGRDVYPGGVKVQSYDEIYPEGQGRRILENSCIVCHGVNFIPDKAASRAGWQAFINLMAHGPADGGLFGSQLIAGPPIVSEERLAPEDIPVLLDYLETNFGPDAPRRAVLQDEWPTLDSEALAKAQFIEYRLPNVPGQASKYAHSPHFGADGMVYVTSGSYIMRVDPTTADIRRYPLPEGNSTHGLAVDNDGTVWSTGTGNFLSHLDPTTGLVDIYQTTETGLHGNTPAFDSKGDIWFSQLMGNKIGHWSRATDTITYYESPVANANPYGLDIDHDDKVWYVEYFNGAVTRFDPQTRTFRRHETLSRPNSLRRLAIDQQNNVWYGVYGYVGQYGSIGRIDAKTGEVTEIELPIKYSHPYDTRPDASDNIWISSMNYVTKFEPETRKFIVYPTPQRTDMPKLEVTRDGAIWFAPRSASRHGYGAAAVVLYPDKDAIHTLLAIPDPSMSNNHVSNYRGPFTRVTGAVKLSKHGAQNQVDYDDRSTGRPRPGVDSR
jgi:virginiamycin B lyase